VIAVLLVNGLRAVFSFIRRVVRGNTYVMQTH